LLVNNRTTARRRICDYLLLKPRSFATSLRPMVGRRRRSAPGGHAAVAVGGASLPSVVALAVVDAAGMAVAVAVVTGHPRVARVVVLVVMRLARIFASFARFVSSFVNRNLVVLVATDALVLSAGTIDGRDGDGVGGDIGFSCRVCFAFHG
jgi:hypothetical protein